MKGSLNGAEYKQSWAAPLRYCSTSGEDINALKSTHNPINGPFFSRHTCRNTILGPFPAAREG